MANIVLAYTINKHHSDVKSELLKRGFQDYVTSYNKVKCYLPSATLWHPNLVNANNGREIFQEIVDTLNKNYGTNDKIQIRQLIAFIESGWSALPGEPHS